MAGGSASSIRVALTDRVGGAAGEVLGSDRSCVCIELVRESVEGIASDWEVFQGLGFPGSCFMDVRFS
jgi:hypothetical protein